MTFSYLFCFLFLSPNSVTPSWSFHFFDCSLLRHFDFSWVTYIQYPNIHRKPLVKQSAVSNKWSEVEIGKVGKIFGGKMSRFFLYFASNWINNSFKYQAFIKCISTVFISNLDTRKPCVTHFIVLIHPACLKQKCIL